MLHISNFQSVCKILLTKKCWWKQCCMLIYLEHHLKMNKHLTCTKKSLYFSVRSKRTFPLDTIVAHSIFAALRPLPFIEYWQKCVRSWSDIEGDLTKRFNWQIKRRCWMLLITKWNKTRKFPQHESVCSIDARQQPTKSYKTSGRADDEAPGAQPNRLTFTI